MDNEEKGGVHNKGEEEINEPEEESVVILS